VESNWVHSALQPPIGLLYQPRVIIMMMEKLVEWWLAGETEVLGENLPQCRFVHHKHYMLSTREHGPPRWEAATNRSSYSTAKSNVYQLGYFKWRPYRKKKDNT
jgi:hypothetical protein